MYSTNFRNPVQMKKCRYKNFTRLSRNRILSDGFFQPLCAFSQQNYCRWHGNRKLSMFEQSYTHVYIKLCFATYIVPIEQSFLVYGSLDVFYALCVHICVCAYRLAKISRPKPLPNDKKSCQIVLKPVNEIRFVRQIKVCVKHYDIVNWYQIFYACPTF